MPGFIKLYRDLRENQLWQEKPFSKGQAWVDMIFRCNHRCVRMGPQYQNALVKRGSFLLSNVKLADAWGWDERTVRRFIKYLVSCDMINYFSFNKFSIYELKKYADFQGIEGEGIPETRAEQTPSRRRPKAEQTPTNNNDNNNNNDKKDNIYSQVIDYLNLKANSKYKPFVDKTKKYINARLNDGFTLDDFYKVIDNKATDWLGTEWEKYLRPETLFGNKFESYLNQKQKEDKKYGATGTDNGKVIKLDKTKFLAPGTANL